MHLSRGDWLAAEQHFSYCRAKKREGVGKMLFVLPKNTYSIVWPPYRTNTIQGVNWEQQGEFSRAVDCYYKVI